MKSLLSLFLFEKEEQMPRPSFQNNNSFILQGIFYRYPFKFMILAMSFFSGLCSIISVFYQRKFINILEAEGFQKALFALFFVFILAILSQFFSFLMRMISVREGQIFSKALSEYIYHHALHLKFEAKNKQTIGGQVNILTQDVAAVNGFIEDMLPSFLQILLFVIMAPLAISITLSIPLHFIILVLTLGLSITTYFGFKQGYFLMHHKVNAQVRMGIVNEWIQNIRLIRVLGLTEIFEQKIQKARIKETENRLGMVTNGSTMNSISQTLPILVNLTGILTLVAYSPNPLTPGDIFFVLWILGIFLIRPIRALPFMLSTYIDAKTSSTRLHQYLKLPTYSPSLEKDYENKSCGLEIKNLSLILNEKEILKNISLNIKKGSFNIIIGEVGCGKSILLQSLIGHVDNTFDEFKIGEKKFLPHQERKKYFSLVPQESFIMSANLRDNTALTYNTPAQNDTPFLAALENAELYLDEESFPHGLETNIGERGVNLSGGQKQRVNLARSSYFLRPIILLDDCLSAVDPETEQKILQNLIRNIWKDETRILVTHRLSALPYADYIFIMEHGEIIEEGSYENLMKTSTKLQELIYKTKSGEQK